jgi:DNA-binding beta-propeller fold protein YncE
MLGAFAAAAVMVSYTAVASGERVAGVVVTDVGGEIVVANADGSGVRALTHPNPLRYENDEGPVPSPDGSLIVFARSGEPARVMLMNADGSRLRSIARAELDSAQWSPDGSRLALETSPSFQLPKPGGPTLIMFKQGISLVARDGSGSRSLVGAAAHGRLGFSWSPDGTRIAYAGHDDISVVDVATGARRVLVAMEGAWRPAWSPDGSRIAFLNDDDDVYVVDATGGKARRLGKSVASETPVWSPDGGRLAFTQQRYPRPSAVVVVAVATGRLTARIAPLGGGGSAAPAWSPDGSRLTFLRARAPGDAADIDGDVWVAAADGSRPRQVTRSFPFGGSHSTARWLADVDAVTPDPEPVALLLRPLASHRLPAEYGVAAVDGKTAAIVKESDGSGGELGIWRAHGPVAWIKGAHADRVALAGDRIYWSWYGSDREGSATELWTATLRGRPVRLASHEGEPEGPALMVAGDRSLVVYTSEGKLWRLEGTRSTLIRREPAGFLEPLSVDNGRVLLWNGRKLQVVNRHGKLLASLPPGTDPVAALLRGQRVMLLGHSQVGVRRIPGGTLAATWPIGEPGRTERVGLAHGSLFPYGTENGYGAANYRLLELTRGRDAILALPQGMSPTDVAIGSAGLFYTAVPPYRGMHGEIGFVPAARLASVLAGM